MASDGIAKVVNSAFLNEIKECNSALWEDVNVLGAYAQEPFSGEWIEQNGGVLLRRLRDELSGQFRMEETYGFVVGPTAIQDRNVTRALDQHLCIVLQCVALSEQFDDLEYCGKLSSETLEMWKQMRRLYESIMEHEALERRLVAAAWAPILPETSQTLEPVHRQ
ncbi:MAG: hypothetical protein ABL921_32440 [Pirellula sp.]